jgi:hypothetical protein
MTRMTRTLTLNLKRILKISLKRVAQTMAAPSLKAVARTRAALIRKVMAIAVTKVTTGIHLRRKQQNVSSRFKPYLNQTL